MVAPPVSTLATLFTAHAPVEEYRRRGAVGGSSAAVSLSAIDTFLMGRIAAYAPVPPHVVDLAADATDGDSVAFWVGIGLPVIVPRVSWHSAPDPDWRPLLRAWAAERTTPGGSGEAAVCLTFVETTLTTPDEWRAITADLPDGTPLIITLAETAETATHTAAHLDLLRRCAPDATVLLLPLGATGTGPVLAHALCACSPEGSRRLTALRELAPFFAASELGLVAPVDNLLIPTILERIRGLVAGNFQFITLVQHAIESDQARESTNARQVEMQANIDALHAVIVDKTAYAQSLWAEMQTTDARQVEMQANIDALHAAIVDKTAYAQSLEDRLQYLEETFLPWKNTVIAGLEDRLRYLEETFLPWKNTVIAGLDREVRSLYASKALKVERLARWLMRR